MNKKPGSGSAKRFLCLEPNRSASTAFELAGLLPVMDKTSCFALGASNFTKSPSEAEFWGKLGSEPSVFGLGLYPSLVFWLQIESEHGCFCTPDNAITRPDQIISKRGCLIRLSDVIAAWKFNVEHSECTLCSVPPEYRKVK